MKIDSRGYFRERAEAGSLINVDGKTDRGSAMDTEKGIHLVSAWANKLGLVLAQVKTQEKSNEITAIPQLLTALDIAGCIITIDAMGCQMQIAADIIQKKGAMSCLLRKTILKPIGKLRNHFPRKSLASWNIAKLPRITAVLRNGKECVSHGSRNANAE